MRVGGGLGHTPGGVGVGVGVGVGGDGDTTGAPNAEEKPDDHAVDIFLRHRQPARITGAALFYIK